MPLGRFRPFLAIMIVWFYSVILRSYTHGAFWTTRPHTGSGRPRKPSPYLTLTRITHELCFPRSLRQARWCMQVVLQPCKVVQWPFHYFCIASSNKTLMTEDWQLVPALWLWRKPLPAPEESIYKQSTVMVEWEPAEIWVAVRSVIAEYTLMGKLSEILKTSVTTVGLISEPQS